ncbi:hypothetical protein Tco_0650595 [Tanacetum coccineum]
MDKEAAVSTVMIKAKIDVVEEIRIALTPTQRSIFEKTCFGHWLNMRDRSVDLEDNDVVKICLLVLLEHGFLGHQLSHNIYDDKLKLVENLSNCWNIFPWGSYIWEYTYSQLRDGLHKRKIWILEAIPATYRYLHKQPTEKIPRALAWESTQPFTWSRCCTLFVGDQLAPSLETLTPTKGESETDWWKASLEYFEGKHVQREAVSQLEFEKDGINEKKRKRGSSQSSLQDPTYDQLMTTVTKLEGIVATLNETVSSLHGTIGTLESRLLALEGDARVSTLTQTMSSLQGTINTLESRLLAFEVCDKCDFGVVSDGDIPAYMSPGPSYTSSASTAQKSLPLANRLKLRVRRSPLKLKSPMRCYSRKMCCTIPPPTSTTMPPVMTISVPMTTTKIPKMQPKMWPKTISVPMTTTEKLKDTLHIDASDAAAQDTFCTEDELQFIGMEKGDKPNYALPDLSKIKRDKYPIYSIFEKKKTDCYLDCLPIEMTCEPSFWDILTWHINAFIELMMRKRPRNAQWTLGLSELVAFHIDSRKLMSMVSVVDALRATIDGTNPRYPSWHKISQSSVYGTTRCGVTDQVSLLNATKGQTINNKSFGDKLGLKYQEYRAKMALMLYETRCERPV